VSQRHPELDSEQAYLDYVHACLQASRTRAARLTANFEPSRGGTTQARFERESVVEGVVNRLTQLDVGDRSLVFGRIDSADIDEQLYIGRLGVWNEDQDPVVVDWRAPASEPFYRATGVNPLGIRLRRHFATRNRTLLGIDDEVFVYGGDSGHATVEQIGGRGQGALIAALEAGRTGRLGDIVSTIQGEQDEIIRSSQHGVMVVQGGPGTGKTVVALHRAAYLLYTHRFPLEGQGVLVVGPNRLFIAYIEQVLPSLGEAGVHVAVLADLLRPRVGVDQLDPEDVARIKGDIGMAKVIGNAVSDRERPLREDLVIGLGVQNLRLTVDQSRRIIEAARRRSRTHNSARKVVEEEFYRVLGRSARRQVDPSEVRDRMRGQLAVREALEWMWPVLTPAHLLHDLYGSHALLRSANSGQFTDAEIQLLYRRRESHADKVIWRFQDVPLLDEARAHLGYRPGRRDEDAVRTYGHICIDEAQDLSPMELRMISRRSLNGSMTVVGDIAQATGAWANSNWDQILTALPQRYETQRRELTVGYRNPRKHDGSCQSGRFPTLAPGLKPPRAVREGGDAPVVVAANGGIGNEVARVVRSEVDQVGEGNVSVIVPDSLAEMLADSLTAEAIPFGGASRHGLDQQVTVVPVRLVKGLEVDSAIVVEPGRIVDEERQGVRSLYVALTRATKRITVVNAEPLPDFLSSPAGSAPT